MLITRKSQLTGVERTMDLNITLEQIDKFQAGAMVQHAFPNLTPEEREFILTGATEEEWDAAVGDPEEE